MKLVIISDPHSGSKAGLCPPIPGFIYEPYQEVFWNWYCKNIAKYGPYDGLIGVGDHTDGEGKKGTLDTAYSNIDTQALAASYVLKQTGVPANKMYIAKGTPFHTSGVTEYEDMIEKYLPGISIQNVQKLEAEGWKIHTRHVQGRSDIPYGQGTPLFKELARMEAEAFRDGKDAPDIVLRGHVHYSAIVGKHGRLAIACPCLQLPLSESNGRRYMAWEYDVGFGVLTLERDREPIYQSVLMEMKIIKDEGYRAI